MKRGIVFTDLKTKRIIPTNHSMKQTTVNDCRIVARSQEVLKALKMALIEEQSEQK